MHWALDVGRWVLLARQFLGGGSGRAPARSGAVAVAVAPERPNAAARRTPAEPDGATQPGQLGPNQYTTRSLPARALCRPRDEVQARCRPLSPTWQQSRLQTDPSRQHGTGPQPGKEPPLKETRNTQPRGSSTSNESAAATKTRKKRAFFSRCGAGLLHAGCQIDNWGVASVFPCGRCAGKPGAAHMSG
jgi:hypothetical protein